MRAGKLSLRQKIGLEARRQLRKIEKEEHKLNTLFWECTLRCNLACKHCGSDCRVESGVDELSGEQFLSIIDTITPHVNPHEVLIIMTGGEALVRKDIDAIGLELYRRGYPWGLVTNGMLLDEKRLESLQKSGLHTLTISLDGFEEAHNYLRGNRLSYERAVRAAKLVANAQELRWDIVTCVNPMNFSYLPEFKDFLIELGLKEWRVFTIFPVGRAANDPNLQLSDQQFYDLMNFIADVNKEGKITLSYGCEGFLGGFEGIARPNFYACYAGVEVASILCDGTISACPSIRFDYKQGNVLNDNFWEVWQNKFEPYRDRTWAKRGKCLSCKMWKYCEGSGMHLHDDEGNLLFCHYQRLLRAEKGV